MKSASEKICTFWSSYFISSEIPVDKFIKIVKLKSFGNIVLALSNFKLPIKMISAMNQLTSTSQFYLYGRKHCTRTGWENAVKLYPKPDLLEDTDLNMSDKVFLITGANAGIGREITTFIASKSATVYMVCRTPSRAEAARAAIVESTKNPNVHLLIGDCGLESDVRRIWHEFIVHRSGVLGEQNPENIKLDGLVCNAGAMDNTKKLSAEGVEVTIATHLLFGTYLLGSLALPLLTKTDSSRLVVVSSGGMYNTKFPAWEVATSSSASKGYDGQMAYAVAKRGQVLLCEEWAKLHKEVTVVSCHPGWTQTEAVDAAYGESKKYLEPLRTTWQGAEGIIWLLVVPSKDIQSGAFYLDRAPQMKYLPGLLYGENSFTKNTPEEVQEMMRKLEEWSSAATRPSPQVLRDAQAAIARTRPLAPMNARAVDIQKFMGNWYVLAHMPTIFEVNARNCIENYRWNAEKNRVSVTFTFTPLKATAPTISRMKGNIVNAPLNTEWTVDPKVVGLYLPAKIGYLILDMAEDDSWVMVGVPDRSYLWIMTRDTPSDFSDKSVPAMTAYDQGEAKLNKELLVGDGELVRKEVDTVETLKPAAVSESVGEVVVDIANIDNPVRTHPPGTNETCAPAAVSVASAGDIQQAQKRENERAILAKALPRAQELGHDINKVMRALWSSAEEEASFAARDAATGGNNVKA